MKVLLIFILFSFISLFTSAHQTVSEKQQSLITNLLNQQLKQHISIENSVKAILDRYPEKIDLVLTAALTSSPNEYHQIMLGAIKAEPALICDVVRNLLESGTASKEEIIRIAIDAEPAYAKEVINIAAIDNPTEIAEIVRVAILAEPFVSARIINDSLLNYPEKMIDILTAAITALPEKVIDLVKVTLTLFPHEGEEVITAAISTSQDKHYQGIVDQAIKSGVSEESAFAAAIAAGADKLVFAKR